MNTDDQDDAPLRDLLGALRAEWQEDANDDELPPESLGDCDVATQRSVEWLRGAWALETDGADLLPPVQLARAAARSRARLRTRRIPRAGAMLIAVAAAVIAIASLWRTPANAPRGVTGGVTDTPVATGTPDPALDSQRTRVAHEHKTEFAPDQFRSRDDGVELVSGSVRLVLLAQGD